MFFSGLHLLYGAFVHEPVRKWVPQQKLLTSSLQFQTPAAPKPPCGRAHWSPWTGSHHPSGTAAAWLISQRIDPIMENQMEKKMENEMETLGPLRGYIGILLPIMENQMEKKMENEMETGVI